MNKDIFKDVFIVVPNFKKLVEDNKINLKIEKPAKLVTGEMYEKYFRKKEKESFTNQLFEFVREKKIREFIEQSKERKFYTEELEKEYRRFAKMNYSKELLKSIEIQELGIVLDSSFEKEMFMLFLFLEKEKELKEKNNNRI